MKASKFLDTHKAFILKQGADGISIADIYRKAGISQETFQLKEEIRWTLPTDTSAETAQGRDQRAAEGCG
jgi:putative transposase